MRRCPNCGYSVAVDAIDCPDCGYRGVPFPATPPTGAPGGSPALPPPPSIIAGPNAPPPPPLPERPRRPGWVAKVAGVLMVIVGGLMVITAPFVALDERRPAQPVAGLMFAVLIGIWMAWGGQYLFRKGWQPGHRRTNVLAVLPGAAYAALIVLALIFAAVGFDVSDGAADHPSGSSAPLGHRWTGDGVSIDLPAGWSAGPGVETLPDEVGTQFGDGSPFADMISLSGYEDGPQILIIMDIPQSPGQSPGQSPEMPLDQLTDQLVDGIMGTTAADVTSRGETTIDGRPATRVALQAPATFARMLVFTWVEGDHVWVTMWVGGGGNFDADTPTYDAATHTITTSGI